MQGQWAHIVHYMDRQRSQFPLIAEDEADASPMGLPYDAEAGLSPPRWTVPHTQLSWNPLYGKEAAEGDPSGDGHQDEEENDLFTPTMAEKQAAAAAASAQQAGKQDGSKRTGMRITIQVPAGTPRVAHLRLYSNSCASLCKSSRTVKQHMPMAGPQLQSRGQKEAPAVPLDRRHSSHSAWPHDSPGAPPLQLMSHLSFRKS